MLKVLTLKTGCFLVQCCMISFFNPVHQQIEDRIWNFHSVAIKQKSAFSRTDETSHWWRDETWRSSVKTSAETLSVAKWVQLQFVVMWLTDACVTKCEHKPKQQRLEMTELRLLADRMDTKVDIRMVRQSCLSDCFTHTEKTGCFQLVNKKTGTKMSPVRVAACRFTEGTYVERHLMHLRFKLAEIMNQFFDWRKIFSPTNRINFVVWLYYKFKIFGCVGQLRPDVPLCVF